MLRLVMLGQAKSDEDRLVQLFEVYVRLGQVSSGYIR